MKLNKRRTTLKSLRSLTFSKVHGMTLIEILIVIGIIAFLAVLISAFLRSQVFKSTDARRKAEIKRIGIAVEEYEKDKNCYPTTSVVECTTGTGLRPYLDKIPCDPTTKVSYIYEHEDSSCPRWYIIYGDLDNETDVDITPNIGPDGLYNYYASSPNAPSITGGNEEEEENPDAIRYYGCFSGVCTYVGQSQPNCEPHYQNSNCYGACTDSQGNPQSQCQ